MYCMLLQCNVSSCNANPPCAATLLRCCPSYVRVAHPKARLLCCAPANYSADLLCSALACAGVSVREMLRLNDWRRPLIQVRASAQRGKEL